MKLNLAEKLIINNPVRTIRLSRTVGWMKKTGVLRPGGRILEAGCGRGAAVEFIAKEFRPSRITAVDLDHEMIQAAVRHLQQKKLEVGLGLAAAENLPFPDRSFDAVFSFGVLHHLPDWQKGLNEIARVVAPGGFYFLEDFFPGWYANFITKRLLEHPREDRFKGPDLREGLEHAGFRMIDVREITGIKIIAVCEKTRIL